MHVLASERETINMNNYDILGSKPGGIRGTHVLSSSKDVIFVQNPSSRCINDIVQFANLRLFLRGFPIFTARLGKSLATKASFGNLCTKLQVSISMGKLTRNKCIKWF